MIESTTSSSIRHSLTVRRSAVTSKLPRPRNTTACSALHNHTVLPLADQGRSAQNVPSVGQERPLYHPPNLDDDLRFRGKRGEIPSCRVMKKISTIRRKNLGDGPLCSPSEWVRGWFATFDAYQPGWRTCVDPEAVVLALVDLFEDDSRRELDPVFLDAFSELLAQLREGNVTTVATVRASLIEICVAPQLPGILERMSALFRPGLPLRDPAMRVSRKQVFIDFIEVANPVLPKVLNRVEWRQDWEEREQARRYCLMSRPDLVETAGEACAESSDEIFAVAAERTI